MPAAGATIEAVFWTAPVVRADAPVMAIIALTLAVLLVGQDLVVYVNRPRG
jgi:hypothetical protein